ncbi:GTPase ObgE [Chryseobacterium sp. CKR4-1]|uniref:GTPase ObgE n=1 Tax=Chryseobacterium sp. CKR4-1 TaxID=3068896 RepID=UPI0027966A46|nr:GTPase ObgE [Chryseobacterium sp. CKR4-1]MDQ1805091.1 GTPase ObgE [Chryseobacterium sp. CKR4-1]
MQDFIDYVKVHCQSGHGGAGSSHLRHEKFIYKGGPDGGNGGRGGNIIMKGNAHEWTLFELHYLKHFKADRGNNGGERQLTGGSGKDVYINVPLGTIAKDVEGNVLGEIMEDQQEIILLHGGKGGLGNEHFKSSTLQTPKFAQPGMPGEEKTIIFELKILADVGLVGLPNTGKSTLLATITAATPKIDNYPFTTLKPNLGVVQYSEKESFLMADIPGIIEGASEGKGLGHRFLRHIERNSILLFVIAADSTDPFRDYCILRSELVKHNPKLENKKHLVAISKTDLLKSNSKADIISKFPDDIKLYFFSCVTGVGVQELKEAIWKDLPSKKR